MSTSDEEKRVEECLARLRSGDIKARDELIVFACERMRGIAHRMLRTFPTVRRWDETDDIVQNAAVRLDRALRDTIPSEPRGLVGLAATQVRRELLDLAKKYRGPESIGANQETNYQRLGDDLRAKIDDAADPRETDDQLERWTQLHYSADKLPEDEREVFHMCWYLGLKQEEIASLLGCSIRTVKRRWEAAKTMLEKKMPGVRPDS
jgi:RNA polymerase sigma factor (sigma-70 family)